MYFFQLLEACARHWEYCSALALGEDVYYNAVYIAMSVRIRAFDFTLVGKHVHSGEEVLGSNASFPNFFPKVWAARWQILGNAPLKGHHTRYITLFSEGIYSVMTFCEVIRMSYAGLRDLLR